MIGNGVEIILALIVSYSNRLATITYRNGHMPETHSAIDAEGYDTSWAEWDDKGRFVRLKEDK